MRFVRLAVAGALLLAGCGGNGGSEAPAGPVLARWHFAGTANLKTNPDATALRAVLANTNSQALLDAALNKLAAVLTDGTNHSAATLSLPRALLTELQRVESLVEVRGTNASSPDWVFALRPGPTAAGWWATNASNLGGALARPATAVVANDWVLIGLGGAGAASLPRLAAEIKKDGRPAGLRPEAWMQLEADLSALAPALGWTRSISWPAISLAWAGRGERLRMEGTLRFALAVVPSPEAWRVPTNTIREPLIGFSALQGVGKWLAAQPWYQPLGVEPAPNQVFAWAQSQIPFQSYLGWEWPDATNTLRRIAPKLPELARERLPEVSAGSIAHATNIARVCWYGLPIWVPFLAPAADPGFVVAGLMPTESKQAPPPPELFAEITGRTNLVYYDWEITGARLEDWRMTGTFYRMVAGYQSPPASSLAQRWLNDPAVTGLLGNTVTEVTRVSPTELRVVRASAAGFTGLELFNLAQWLDDPAFPRRSEPARSPTRRAPAPPPPR
jgi:hypothetical protein